MPSYSFRLGVATIQYGVETTTSVPDLTTLVFTASGQAYTSATLNDVKRALDTTATYQVMLGLVGKDNTNTGYTVGQCSPGSGIVSLTTGQGVRINVPNANWPANFDQSVCVAIFLKINAAQFQLAEFAYMDTQNDFYHMVIARPKSDAPFFATATLQSKTADPILGDRNPTGFSYLSLTPSSGGAHVTREVAPVPVNIDTVGSSINYATSRTASIEVDVMANDVLDIVRANAGNYANFSAGGATFQIAQMSMNSALALVAGNKPMKMFLPPDNAGRQEIRLYLGQNLQNQEGNQEDWIKDGTTPVKYKFSPAPIDALINAQHTEIIYKRS